VQQGRPPIAAWSDLASIGASRKGFAVSQRREKGKSIANMHSPRKRRDGPSRKVAAALVFAACLGQGAGSSPGYPGASTGGANPMPQRQGQPPSGGYPPQQHSSNINNSSTDQQQGPEARAKGKPLPRRPHPKPPRPGQVERERCMGGEGHR
ncbi:unnamed protein product, partial [Ectocarpus sp. 12 AP-2014]